MLASLTVHADDSVEVTVMEVPESGKFATLYLGASALVIGFGGFGAENAAIMRRIGTALLKAAEEVFPSFAGDGPLEPVAAAPSPEALVEEDFQL